MKTCLDCGTKIAGHYAIRCRKCSGVLRKSGSETLCKQCGKSFYAPRWVLEDVKRNSGTYCSLECAGKAKRGRQPPWAKPNEVIMHSAGYRLTWKPDHPRAIRGRVFEHILVAEEKIGRLILPSEQVHHIDRDKTNNHPDNLAVYSNADHQRLHSGDRPKKRVTVACQECGVEFQMVPWKANPDNPRAQVKYCSVECKHKGRGKKISATKQALKASRPERPKQKTVRPPRPRVERLNIVEQAELEEYRRKFGPLE